MLNATNFKIKIKMVNITFSFKYYYIRTSADSCKTAFKHDVLYILFASSINGKK